MRDPTPSTHAPEARFDTTHWSRLSPLGDGPDADQTDTEALRYLCQTYWFPLYAYARRKGHQRADAQDLTQGFLSRMIERDAFRDLDPTKGRLRSFLLACFNHHLADAHDHRVALKRGGGAMPVDWAQAEIQFQEQTASQNNSPERDFDLAWAHEVLQHTLRNLEQQYAEANNSETFEALQPFLTGEADHGQFADVANRLGITQSSARAAATRMRQRYRKLLRQEIAATVSDRAQADEEFQEICGILRGD